AAMLEILRAGRAAGYIRPGVDLARLADRLCQSMLHVGVGVSHLEPRPELVPPMRCRILLQGVAARPPEDARLDRSRARRAADEAIATWDEPDAGEDERATLLRTVARAEFGRRGYEATTIRDIASAAGLSTGSVYRLIGSKDELLIA